MAAGLPVHRLWRSVRLSLYCARLLPVNQSYTVVLTTYLLLLWSVCPSVRLSVCDTGCCCYSKVNRNRFPSIATLHLSTPYTDPTHPCSTVCGNRSLGFLLVNYNGLGLPQPIGVESRDVTTSLVSLTFGCRCVKTYEKMFLGNDKVDVDSQ